MSILETKGKQIWSMMKVQNLRVQVIVVQPSASTENCGSDDKDKIGTKHLNTYRTVWTLIDLLASVVGVSIFKEMGTNIRLVFTTSVICVAFPSLFYTMVVVWPNVSQLLEVICIFGVLLPATLKYRLIVKEIKHVISIIKFFENILKCNAKGRRADCLRREMENVLKKEKMFSALTVLCFAVFSLYPIYVYVNESRLVPLMRIEFPFLDQTNMKGYLIGLAIMLLFGVLAVVGSVAFDLMITVLLLQYGSLVTQLIHDLDDYREMWRNEATSSAQYRELFLRNICMKYQDIDRYIRCFNKVFAGNTCQSICILYASLICSVYAVFNNGWISGYGFCIFCFVQLYIPCMLGTYVNDQNNRMNQAFYFTPWYEYSVKAQKTISILLHASSLKTKEMRIGPFAPLNVQTGLQMTKNIYSYYTAMSNLT